LRQQVQPAIVSRIASGTRFIFGLGTEKGDVYWSIAHGSRVNPRWRYKSIIVAVLAERRQGSLAFTLIARSCPFEFDGLRERWRASFSYVHSVFDFNVQTDTAILGLHLDDRVNLVISVHRVGSWLSSAYHRYTKSGKPSSCKAFDG
jgi:hypothetical protein